MISQLSYTCRESHLKHSKQHTLVGVGPIHHFSIHFHTKLYRCIRNSSVPIGAHYHRAVRLASLFSERMSSTEVITIMDFVFTYLTLCEKHRKQCLCPSLSFGVSIVISLWLLWDIAQA